MWIPVLKKKSGELNIFTCMPWTINNIDAKSWILNFIFGLRFIKSSTNPIIAINNEVKQITLKLQNAQKDTEAYQTRITEDGKRLKSLGENNVAMQKQLAYYDIVGGAR